MRKCVNAKIWLSVVQLLYILEALCTPIILETLCTLNIFVTLCTPNILEALLLLY